MQTVALSRATPFWNVNRNLSFDREATVGFRLDLPAGDSIAWAPGETREVTLVELAGAGDA